MPNKRSPGQTLISLSISIPLLETADGALARAGYSDRSQFFRDAVYEKLERLGIHLPAEITLAPGRIRRGRQPSSTSYSRAVLNDAPRSTDKDVADATALAPDAETAVSAAQSKRRRKH